MRWPYESAVMACPECGFNEVPNFRQERRISYREIGEPDTPSYHRELGQALEVTVCVQCGHVVSAETIIS